MKRLNLTLGQVTFIDDEDLQKVEDFHEISNSKSIWITSWNKAKTRCYAAHFYYDETGRRRKMYLHTLLSGFDFVDHINGNSLDNRKENLRQSDNSKNGANTSAKPGFTSKYKGVVKTVYKSGAVRYRSTIQYQGKSIHLGYFEYEVDAADAYDKAAEKLWGKHARLNNALSV